MALVGLLGESTWLKGKNSGSLKIVEYELPKWKCKEKKKVEKIEQNAKELWNNIKKFITFTIGMPEEEREKMGEEIFEVVVTKNFTKVMTDTINISN